MDTHAASGCIHGENNRDFSVLTLTLFMVQEYSVNGIRRPATMYQMTNFYTPLL